MRGNSQPLQRTEAMSCDVLRQGQDLVGSIEGGNRGWLVLKGDVPRVVVMIDHQLVDLDGVELHGHETLPPS